MTEDDIVEAVQELQPKAKESSIRISLERAGKHDDWCEPTSYGYKYAGASNGQSKTTNL